MPKDIVLKPCPSCGAEARIGRTIGLHYWSSDDDVETWGVQCKYCSFQCGGFRARSNAIKRWNLRVKEKP